MSIEADVREIRKMFSDHITNENKIFTANAQEHGTMLAKLESIEMRLNEGNNEFDGLENRINTVEMTISNYKGWAAAIILTTGIMVKFIGLLIDKIWPSLI